MYLRERKSSWVPLQEIMIYLKPVYTMDYEVGPWKMMTFFHGLTSGPNFHGPVS